MLVNPLLINCLGLQLFVGATTFNRLEVVEKKASVNSWSYSFISFVS